MTLFLKNAVFVDWQTLSFETGHLAVSPDRPLSKPADIPAVVAAPDRIIDCSGKLVTRAFGCGHHHVYSALARGMPAPHRSPSNFPEILQYIWWRLDKNLDLEMIRASALATAVFAARNGVTFIIDHHASPHAVAGSLETIRDAFELVGISHLLCYEISDRDGEAIREEGLAATDTYLAAGNQGLVGLHASFTVGDELLQKAARLAEKHGTGIHVHVAEDLSDQNHCLATWGKRVISRFHAAGVLESPRTILAHCVHLDPAERQLLAASPAWIAQNVESNLNNNVGITAYREFSERVMLGTDGMHSDMLRGAKATFFVGQGTENLGFPEIYHRFRGVHRYLTAGGFAGDEADRNLVILDYDPPTEINPENYLGHFVFGLDSAHVHSVISGGRLIVENRKLQTVDEAEIMKFAREMGTALWKKLSL